MVSCLYRCLVISILCLGILILCAGIVVISLLPSLIRQKVVDQVVLKPDASTTKSWANPPVTASIQFWIFNVTNPNEIVFQGAKPSLFQKGPYGFREKLEKRNIKFSSNNTLSFSASKEYFFEPELSCDTCRMEDKFTIPNIPYLTVMKLIRGQTTAKGILDFLGGLLLRLVGEHPFVSDVTPRQLLFEGYDDQIFDMVNRFSPGLLPEKMGLFYKRNGSEDGPYQIRTGQDDITKLGEIITWDGHSDLLDLGWWNPNYTQASMINGTDGGTYAPFVQKTDSFAIFARDICRSTYLKYESDVDIDGINSYRFRPPSETFSSHNKANRGFCWPSNERYYSDDIQPKLDGGLCLPAGMLDVSKCYSNAPIVMTSPQFVYCPDEVLDSVDGLLEPSKEFTTNIDLEPTTGVVLSASKKLQLNVAMYTDPKKPLVFMKMKPVIIPIIWLNESVEVDKATRDYIYKNVVTSQNAAYAGSYSALGIGAGITVIGILILIVLIVKRRNAVSDQTTSPPQPITDADPISILS